MIIEPEMDIHDLLSYLVGMCIALYVISCILTWIWRKFTKKEITRKVIIIGTVMAGIIYFLLYRDFLVLHTINLTVLILLIIAVSCVLLIRLSEKKKREIK